MNLIKELELYWKSDIDDVIKALHTQYQIRSDAIIPRASQEAPTMHQLMLIRDAHLSIATLVKIVKKLSEDLPRDEEICKKIKEDVMKYFDVSIPEYQISMVIKVLNEELKRRQNAKSKS